LLVFYDIKECLLIKIRDIWLELGEFAFSMALEELYTQLSKVMLKNEENKLIQKKVIEILGRYIVIFNGRYPECRKEYCSGKVKELIRLLEEKKVSEMEERE
jgi:hypothetical protein